MNYNGTVTMSLEMYEEMRALIDKATEEAARARQDEAEARMLCRDILKRAFTVETVSYQETPEIMCHLVPEVVAILNEGLSQASTQTGTLYQVDLPAYANPIATEEIPSCYLYVKLRNMGTCTSAAKTTLKEELF